ncbi:hypothetical protein, partial [uncultured Desulfovibrio sp.]|uniref:hypothetical protein n=1 Tax=uncultured Desulfovibrio sp. TaxID=167968 RepID=UPI00260C0FAC
AARKAPRVVEAACVTVSGYVPVVLRVEDNRHFLSVDGVPRLQDGFRPEKQKSVVRRRLP